MSLSAKGDYGSDYFFISLSAPKKILRNLKISSENVSLETVDKQNKKTPQLTLKSITINLEAGILIKDE